MTAPLTTAEAAALLGLTTGRVRQLCRSGELPATRHGRDWLVQPDDVKKYRPPPRGRPKKTK